jgi:hypothetical protein
VGELAVGAPGAGLEGWPIAGGLLLGLFAAGFLSWAVSTFSAGGGSLLIVAAVSYVIGGRSVAPVVTVASLMASPARMMLLWSRIRWRVVAWYVPGAGCGALLGAWVFSRLETQWIQVLLALFLISTVWQYRLGERDRSFPMRLPWFVPVSVVSGLISAVVGASGLMANPFYLNYGLMKEEMIATRAVNSLVIQIVKIGSYWVFGVLNWTVLQFGLAAGLGAVSAICVANRWLSVLSARHFRQLALLVMVVGGMMILWRQRGFLVGLLVG